MAVDALNRGGNPRLRHSQALMLGKGGTEINLVRLADSLAIAWMKYCLKINARHMNVGNVSCYVLRHVILALRLGK
jgi:hypothetical protein